MSKFLCGECIHNSDKGGGCLIPKNLGYVDNCNRYLPKDKPIVQTNEEYIHSLNTEQLAKVLLSFCQYPCEICKIQCDDGNACTYNKALNTIVEWLKQPHIKE